MALEDPPHNRSYIIPMRRRRRRITLIVCGTYLIKATLKLIGGIATISPALIYDGIHSLADIAEHLSVTYAGYHARKPDHGRYPLGRGPLLHLIGLLIFIGIVVLGLQCVWDGVSSVGTVAVNILADSAQLPTWVTAGLASPSEIGSNAWVAALVMLGSFAISNSVWQWESREARVLRLPELVDDAEELRSDSYIELSVGLGILLGWLAMLTSRQFGWHEFTITNIGYSVNGIILLGLGAWLTWLGGVGAIEKYRLLMNPSVDAATQDRLEQQMNRYLASQYPDGEAYLELPIKAYHRGEDIYIEGTVILEQSIVSAQDDVTNSLQRLSCAILQHESDSVITRFQIRGEILDQSFEREWTRLLDSVWGVRRSHPLANGLIAVRRGNNTTALRVAEGYAATSDKEEYLKLWILAESALGCEGPSSAIASKLDAQIEKRLSDASEDLSGPLVLLRCWQLVRLAPQRPADESRLLALQNVLERVVNEGDELPEIVRAEAAFALGYSWERANEYDLSMANRYYRHANALYARSRCPLESDRLKTSWGHQLTLLYELEEAGILLESSRDIKKLKRDEYGLAIVHGCLGDLFTRLGDWDAADESYRQDILALRKWDNRLQTASVMTKQGDMLVRRGLVTSDPTWIRRGIELCSDAAEIAGTNEPNRFFAIKGQLKGLLAQYDLAEVDSFVGGDEVQTIGELLNQLRPHGMYQQAFALRLRGRYARISGDVQTSRKLLQDAASRFLAMRRDDLGGRSMSLQAIACELECAIWTSSNPVEVSSAIANLQSFIDELSGRLGAAEEHIRALAASIRRAHGDQGEVLTDRLAGQRLVGFIEG